MLYFDTDVLINYLFNQNQLSHSKAIAVYEQAIKEKVFFTSLLTLQELSYVANRLGCRESDIEIMIQDFMIAKPVAYTTTDFIRGIQLAKLIGFQNINDCLHTAIAENNGCTEIYTFNKSDFQKIQRHTKVKITIL
ncbi:MULTISPECIES: type II toxin-antitoxin system VapC family toxin [unclassified Arcicella]|uniref:type II toxin-antitoxin system VapC family toxin n=1 Tax=unclassified Arcicella TaxID=2644986 RepID=UPI002854B7AB|nr:MULTISPECIES: type II toxin-antitoxin system VapC family toxin [unclassified Arcicella]MDR6564574.1 putative nucleic acid-binding protein [Arcicella sp. BE51]MDR6825716.1 putative nucleic acid-binding protein [Arcicella sp. BE139]